MSSRHIAQGGLLSALTIIILYLTLLIPTNTLTLLTLASFMVPIALIRCNFKTACIVYMTSSLLSGILLPLNITLLYLSFFGCYGLIKSLIERFDNLTLEWVCKLLFFNTIFIILFTFTEALLNVNWLAPLQTLSTHLLPYFENGHLIILWVSGQIVFIIFDYALTLLIDMYYKYLH